MYIKTMPLTLYVMI